MTDFQEGAKAKSKIDSKQEMGFNRDVAGTKKFEIELSNSKVAIFFAKEQPDYDNVFACCVIQRKNEDGIVQGMPKHHWFNVAEWEKIKKGVDSLVKDIAENK